MIESEIIKTLEKYIESTKNIKYGVNKMTMIDAQFLIDILDFINQQKAEKEKYKKEHIDIDNFARTICKERMLKGKAIADFEDLQEYIRKEKSEAIKDFAERLTNKAELVRVNAFNSKWAISDEDIDNLVKEMTESEK